MHGARWRRQRPLCGHQYRVQCRVRGLAPICPPIPGYVDDDNVLEFAQSHRLPDSWRRAACAASPGAMPRFGSPNKAVSDTRAGGNPSALRTVMPSPARAEAQRPARLGLSAAMRQVMPAASRSCLMKLLRKRTGGRGVQRQRPVIAHRELEYRRSTRAAHRRWWWQSGRCSWPMARARSNSPFSTASTSAALPSMRTSICLERIELGELRECVG